MAYCQWQPGGYGDAPTTSIALASVSPKKAAARSHLAAVAMDTLQEPLVTSVKLVHVVAPGSLKACSAQGWHAPCPGMGLKVLASQLREPTSPVAHVRPRRSHVCAKSCMWGGCRLMQGSRECGTLTVSSLSGCPGPGRQGMSPLDKRKGPRREDSSSPRSTRPWSIGAHRGSVRGQRDSRRTPHHCQEYGACIQRLDLCRPPPANSQGQRSKRGSCQGVRCDRNV